jgi:putative oxidoreductase
MTNFGLRLKKPTVSKNSWTLWDIAISPLPVPASWYAIPLRVVVGFGFFEHGYAKLARGWEHFAGILHAIGIPFADLLALATILIEVVGGILVFAGAFIPLAAVPMIIVLLVATFTVHIQYGFSSIKLQSFGTAGAHFGQPGYETDLLYIAAIIALCMGGAGPLSFDGYVNRRRAR